jgi:proteasome lid subunit RPN8/RPN11
MTRYTLSLIEEHRQQLQQAVLRDERERGALAICGRSRHTDPWTGEIEERFLVREIIAVADDMYVERNAVRMTWSTTPFYQTLKLAEAKDFAVAVVHSHPNGPLAFSPADDFAEKEIFEIAFNRLDSERPHLSIVMDGDGELESDSRIPNRLGIPESADF